MKKLLWAAAATSLALTLAACGSDSDDSGSGDTDTGSSPATTAPNPAGVASIGVAYDLGGRGDGGFNDLAYAGATSAAKALGAKVEESTATPTDTDADRVDHLTLLAESGSNPIIAVGFDYEAALQQVAPQYPDIWFAIVDDVIDAPNVAGLTFSAEQGSYLVGVAAAMESKTKKVGFIGGVDTSLIQNFEVGFKAGVESVGGVTETAKYLTEPPDFGGFNDPAKGTEAATGLFEAGNDVVYAAAGGSNSGAFTSAKSYGNGVKIIGVDSDQYNTADPSVQDVIITSMLKHVEVAVDGFVKSVADQSIKAGVQNYDLAKGGVGFSTSGNLLQQATIDAVNAAAEKIKSGAITVPTVQ